MRRPRTRRKCKSGRRPCPWVSCRYHLYLDVNAATGTIKYNYPDRELWEVQHTCALDLADHGEQTFEEIGQVLNLTRERIRQLTGAILEKMYEELAQDEPRASMLPLTQSAHDME